MDVIIVGGSAAGITAATTCRRHYPEKTVLLVRQEKKVLIPCGIPYIFGTVGSPDKNLIPDAVLEKNGIELLIDAVTDIEPSKRVVTTARGEKLGYGKLILATGSSPLMPPIPGVETKNIFVVQKDVSYLQETLDQLNRSSNLVIVGGGFIGVEFADECRKNRNIDVTIVEMLPHCLMLNFDDELCAIAEAIEKEHGINILAPEKVEAFLGNGKVKGVKLASGWELDADMVILGMGCAANTELAEKTGLTLGPTKGIQVNRHMQTTDENIFACGDCAEKFSFFDGQPSNCKLASIATREARIAGANLFGMRRVNEGAIGVFSTVLGETAFALAGLSEREAKEKGYKVVLGESEAPNRHPGNMPGMANLKAKLLFERDTGVILGGQVVGAKCGGELINAISACIHGRMTADDIALFPMGTHPALTASPIAYQLTNAAEMALRAMR
ncbi:MAG: FAD-dependent oxidoreductase [Thermodesulfobacteriota bacterium]|nr:FAD-dependent oxidoreductase [Thermodesulfobacteriota bacterium]